MTPATPAAGFASPRLASGWRRLLFRLGMYLVRLADQPVALSPPPDPPPSDLPALGAEPERVRFNTRITPGKAPWAFFVQMYDGRKWRVVSHAVSLNQARCDQGKLWQEIEAGNFGLD